MVISNVIKIATPNVFMGSVLLIFFRVLFVLFYYVSLRFEFRVLMSVTISAYKLCSVRFSLQLFVWGSCLIYVICVCLCIVVSNTYCVVFCIFRRLVYPMLPVSLNYPFLILSSVFSKVYLLDSMHTSPIIRCVNPML